MKIDPDQFFAELEALGEDEVRKNLASEQVYGAAKRSLATEWVRRKDQEHADALNREQIAVARSAAEAAREAATSARDTAREARTSNKIAIAAVIVAVASMIVAAITLFS